MKTCTHCGQQKPDHDYAITHKHGLERRRPMCKNCSNKKLRDREYLRKHPPGIEKMRGKGWGYL